MQLRMRHCAGGTGATSFGNQGASPPISDADHDVLMALDALDREGQR
jgi:feruloyl esterase